VRLVRAAPAVLALGALAGCSTTQQEATRLQLNSARIRASQLPLHVGRRNPDIRVAAVELLKGRDGTAVVVRMRNLADRVLTDLPVSVGVIAAHGVKRYLNGRAGIDYFDSHLSAIGPDAGFTWVFTSRAAVPAHARPFAYVGTTVPGFSSARTLPQITVQPEPRSGPPSIVRLTVRNDSAVPQYQLQVYATISGRRGYLAAGTAMVAHLGTGASTSVQMTLLGSATKAMPALQAPPTIFG
jgi:hypothetical protein